MDLLQWAIIAFGVAIVAGLFGFTGVARGAASAGRTLFGPVHGARRSVSGISTSRCQHPRLNISILAWG